MTAFAFDSATMIGEWKQYRLQQKLEEYWHETAPLLGKLSIR